MVETRPCSKCGEQKPLGSFYRDKSKKSGLQSACKTCSNSSRDAWANRNADRLRDRRRIYLARDDVKSSRREYENIRRRRDVSSVLLTHARKRSKTSNIECSISKADIVVPHSCPVLGIPLFVSEGKVSDNSPTLDRIDPSRGYVKDNVHVISHRANRIKNNATPQELMLVARYMEALCS